MTVPDNNESNDAEVPPGPCLLSMHKARYQAVCDDKAACEHANQVGPDGAAPA